MSKIREQIRLTIERAAAEFGTDHRTLLRALTASAIVAGQDGKYSISQIHRACTGDLQAQKVRETRHRANILEMEEAEKRGSLIAVDAVRALGEKVFIAVR